MTILRIILALLLIWSAIGDYEFVTKLTQPLETRVKCCLAMLAQLSASVLLFL